MKTPTISSAIIIKNEAKRLPKLLKQLNYFSDEVIVVDTGSTDKSKEIAEKAGAKVYDFKWVDDFSKARNFSFSKCKGDFIWWVDADDTIKGIKNIKKLAKGAKKLGVDAFYLEYHYSFDKQGSCTNVHWKPRLVRRGAFKWEKTIHENLVSTERVNEIKERSVVILHSQTKEEAKKSAERNLRILMAEYNKDGEKTDPRTLHYLGSTLFTMKRFREALEFFFKHTKSSGWNEEKYMSMMKSVICLKYLGDNDSAISVAMEATKLFSNWADAYFAIAELYLIKEDYRKSVDWAETGFTKDRPKTTLAINPQDYTLLPLGRYAIALLHLNRVKEAQRVINRLKKMGFKSKKMIDLEKTINEATEADNFVSSFLDVVDMYAKKSKSNLPGLFKSLPQSLDEDVRLANAQNELLPPKKWGKKSIVFFCGQSLEDWASPSLLTGIGGSESAIIYISQEFVKKGYDVTVYNRCGALRGNYEGVEYKPYYHFNPSDKFNILISWRAPTFFDHPMKARKKILWIHDRPFNEQYSKRLLNNLDRVIVLSEYQRKCIDRVPDDKILVSANGLEMSEVKEALKTTKRKRYNMIYASSYDRGLINLLRMWPKVKKAVPEATLDIYYGWDNFDLMAQGNPAMQKFKKEMIELMKQPGIKEHGRVNKQKLAEAFTTADVWAYPSHFWEISCIMAMQAQASGAIPVTTDFAALKETVRHGHLVSFKGSKFEELGKKTLREYRKELIKVLKGDNEGLRNKMMKDCQEYYTWKRVADEWESNLF